MNNTFTIDDIDKQLLNIIQMDFPLTVHPFKEIGRLINISEQETIERLNTLKNEKYIRFIGPVINTEALGFDSVLIGMKVDESNIYNAVSIINSHPGVSHNYQRNDDYNIWFTLSVPHEIDIKQTAETIADIAKAPQFIFLPALKIFKIGVILDAFHKPILINPPLPKDETSQAPFDKGGRGDLKNKMLINPPLLKDEISILKLTQSGIPIISEPFKEISAALDISEQELLSKLKNLIDKSVIRRFGAIIAHRLIGYRYNFMAVWQTDEYKTDICASYISSYPNVTHCYTRPSYPDWPYNLYSMVHCSSEEEGNPMVNNILATNTIKNYKILTTEKEYKKKRLDYFSDAFKNWP